MILNKDCNNLIVNNFINKYSIVSLDCLNLIKSSIQIGVELRNSSITKYSTNSFQNYFTFFSLNKKNFVFDLNRYFCRFSKKTIKLKYNNRSSIISKLFIKDGFFNDYLYIKNTWKVIASDYISCQILDFKKSFFTKENWDRLRLVNFYLPLFSLRQLSRKKLRSLFYLTNSINLKKKVINRFVLRIKAYFLNYSKLNYREEKSKYLNLFYKKFIKRRSKFLNEFKYYPIILFLKKTSSIYNIKKQITVTFMESIILNNFRRHPNTQLRCIKKNIQIALSYSIFFKAKPQRVFDEDLFTVIYKMSWRYFKYKIERFFYNQLHVRVHIWFLNIWDVFLNSMDSLWQWFRYEDKTTYFLTRKGQRFLIEDKEEAKFYLRTMTLTLTMVGGVKLFLDKISLFMKKYRNNWAFILSTTKSLRFCINFFWFRFFVNYKITLQGKIGGFLRAQKKIFKKGSVSIENKLSAITYYRGYPVTRFGTYNLSFWLQYRIPNLIEKFEELEYIDTMKILLSTYTVPWLANRLAKIIHTMLTERIKKIRRKVAQYSKRVDSREILLYDVLKIKKYYFKNTKISNNSILKYKKLKNIILKKKYKKLFNKSLYKKIIKKRFFRKN